MEFSTKTQYNESIAVLQPASERIFRPRHLLAGYFIVYEFQSVLHCRRHTLAREFARICLKVIRSLESFTIVVFHTFFDFTCVLGTHFIAKEFENNFQVHGACSLVSLQWSLHASCSTSINFQSFPTSFPSSFGVKSGIRHPESGIWDPGSKIRNPE